MKKQQARNLYFQSELSQTRIAELLDVDRKTIYLWIKEGRWAEIKKSAQHMPSILAEQYYSQLLAINQMILNREEQYPTQQEADIIRKLTLTIKNIKDGQTVGETVEVLMNFIHRLSKTDLALAKQILPHTDKYIRDYANPSILRPIEKEVEETEEEKHADTTPQPESPQQQTTTPQNPPQPNGSLRASKQSLTTQTGNHDHANTAPPIESLPEQPSQTPSSQNIEPAIVELSNCQIAELSKTGYKWAMNEQPIFTMQEALIRYRQGDWSDNTWLRFLKWHSQQNGENLSTSTRSDQ
ncbi:MAG TPA: hypothetical protein VN721_14250 [Flavipsychrobacter sp.]|nr:hypothetical protein [Flavipsychrobacter sp.]